MTRAIVAFVVLAFAACHIGTSVRSFAPAVHPRGVEVDVDSRGETVSGELLAVSDTGLLVLLDPALLFAPYPAIRAAKFHQLSITLDGGGAPAVATRERLRLFSRFPQGVSPEQLRALLAAYHQTSPTVLTP